jgi:hypothetical protein
MTSKRTSINWSSVTWFSFLVAAAAAAAALAPLLAHKLRFDNRTRREHLEASIALDSVGIARCQDHETAQIDSISPFVPGASRVSVDVMPSFQNAWGIRLIGNDVYLVMLDSPLSLRSPPPPPAGSQPSQTEPPPMTARVGHSPLTPKLALQLSQLFGDRIATASDDPVLGLDGTSYRFTAGSCAETWSPDPETGAGRLVQLAELLSTHAQLTKGEQRRVSERRIARLVGSFHHH